MEFQKNYKILFKHYQTVKFYMKTKAITKKKKYLQQLFRNYINLREFIGRKGFSIQFPEISEILSESIKIFWRDFSMICKKHDKKRRIEEMILFTKQESTLTAFEFFELCALNQDLYVPKFATSIISLLFIFTNEEKYWEFTGEVKNDKEEEPRKDEEKTLFVDDFCYQLVRIVFNLVQNREAFPEIMRRKNFSGLVSILIDKPWISSRTISLLVQLYVQVLQKVGSLKETQRAFGVDDLVNLFLTLNQNLIENNKHLSIEIYNGFLTCFKNGHFEIMRSFERLHGYSFMYSHLVSFMRRKESGLFFLLLGLVHKMQFLETVYCQPEVTTHLRMVKEREGSQVLTNALAFSVVCEVYKNYSSEWGIEKEMFERIAYTVQSPSTFFKRHISRFLQALFHNFAVLSGDLQTKTLDLFEALSNKYEFTSEFRIYAKLLLIEQPIPFLNACGNMSYLVQKSKKNAQSLCQQGIFGLISKKLFFLGKQKTANKNQNQYFEETCSGLLNLLVLLLVMDPKNISVFRKIGGYSNLFQLLNYEELRPNILGDIIKIHQTSTNENALEMVTSLFEIVKKSEQDQDNSGKVLEEKTLSKNIDILTAIAIAMKIYKDLAASVDASMWIDWTFSVLKKINHEYISNSERPEMSKKMGDTLNLQVLIFIENILKILAQVVRQGRKQKKQLEQYLEKVGVENTFEFMTLVPSAEFGLFAETLLDFALGGRLKHEQISVDLNNRIFSVLPPFAHQQIGNSSAQQILSSDTTFVVPRVSIAQFLFENYSIITGEMRIEYARVVNALIPVIARRAQRDTTVQQVVASLINKIFILASDLANAQKLCKVGVVRIVLANFHDVLEQDTNWLQTLALRLVEVFAINSVSAQETKMLLGFMKNQKFSLSILHTLIRICRVPERPDNFIRFSASQNSLKRTRCGEIEFRNIESLWPSQEGYSLAFWFAYKDTGSTISLFTFSFSSTKPENADLRTQSSNAKKKSPKNVDVVVISVDSLGHLLFQNKFSKDEYLFEKKRLKPAKWHHITITHAPVFGENNFGQLSLFVNGRLVDTGVCCYPQGFRSPLKISCGGFCSDVSDSPDPPQWFLASSYVFLGTFDPNRALLLYLLGPNYSSSFEESIPKYLLFNQVMQRRKQDKFFQSELLQTNKNIYLSSLRNDLIFAFIPKTNRFMFAAEWPQIIDTLPKSSAVSLKRRLILYASIPKMKGYCKKEERISLKSAIHSIGGVRSVLYFVASSLQRSRDCQYLAICFLNSVLENNPLSIQEMSQIEGYELVARILTKKAWKLDKEILSACFSMCGCSVFELSPLRSRESITNENREVKSNLSEMITNASAFRSLVLNWKIWKRAPLPVQSQLFSSVYQLISPEYSKYSRHNRMLVADLGIVSHLLDIFTQDPLFPSELTGTVIQIIEEFISSTKDYELVFDFILQSHQRPQKLTITSITPLDSPILPDTTEFLQIDLHETTSKNIRESSQSSPTNSDNHQIPGELENDLNSENDAEMFKQLQTEALPQLESTPIKRLHKSRRKARNHDSKFHVRACVIKLFTEMIQNTNNKKSIVDFLKDCSPKLFLALVCHESKEIRLVVVQLIKALLSWDVFAKKFNYIYAFDVLGHLLQQFPTSLPILDELYSMLVDFTALSPVLMVVANCNYSIHRYHAIQSLRGIFENSNKEEFLKKGLVELLCDVFIVLVNESDDNVVKKYSDPKSIDSIKNNSKNINSKNIDSKNIDSKNINSKNIDSKNIDSKNIDSDGIDSQFSRSSNESKKIDDISESDEHQNIELAILNFLEEICDYGCSIQNGIPNVVAHVLCTIRYTPNISSTEIRWYQQKLLRHVIEFFLQKIQVQKFLNSKILQVNACEYWENLVNFMIYWVEMCKTKDDLKNQIENQIENQNQNPLKNPKLKQFIFPTRTDLEFFHYVFDRLALIRAKIEKTPTLLSHSTKKATSAVSLQINRLLLSILDSSKPIKIQKLAINFLAAHLFLLANLIENESTAPRIAFYLSQVGSIPSKKLQTKAQFIYKRVIQNQKFITKIVGKSKKKQQFFFSQIQKQNQNEKENFQILKNYSSQKIKNLSKKDEATFAKFQQFIVQIGNKITANRKRKNNHLKKITNLSTNMLVEHQQKLQKIAIDEFAKKLEHERIISEIWIRIINETTHERAIWYVPPKLTLYAIDETMDALRRRRRLKKICLFKEEEIQQHKAKFTSHFFKYEKNQLKNENELKNGNQNQLKNENENELKNGNIFSKSINTQKQINKQFFNQNLPEKNSVPKNKPILHLDIIDMIIPNEKNQSTTNSYVDTIGKSQQTGLHSNEKMEYFIKCVRINLFTDYYGELVYSDKRIHFFIEKYTELSSSGKTITKHTLAIDNHLQISYSEIREIHKRRYLLQNKAMEIFLTTGKSYFFAFQTSTQRNDAYDRLVLHNMPNFLHFESESNGKILRKSITKLWQNHKISNFAYLMHLNILAGRTYCDLSQYPVLPNILREFESADLNLSSTHTFRDLSKPMGAQNAARMKYFALKFKDLLESEQTPYHYGTHYSNPAVALFFLVRIEPYSSLLVHLQSGKFDLPDRLFDSYEKIFNKSEDTAFP
ncbi:beach domain-containing protein [Anaeramoeba ignava]|uniref:Beach domain-containing protein n=1 Tax=Anaeramoeba ignava TaxID=1746090 RepID=A0A9Q0REG1_ANAIG|nr:beach domain-containing protein [Anaeramoeba ignava]